MAVVVRDRGAGLAPAVEREHERVHHEREHGGEHGDERREGELRPGPPRQAGRAEVVEGVREHVHVAGAEDRMTPDAKALATTKRSPSGRSAGTEREASGRLTPTVLARRIAGMAISFSRSALGTLWHLPPASGPPHTPWVVGGCASGSVCAAAAATARDEDASTRRLKTNTLLGACEDIFAPSSVTVTPCRVVVCVETSSRPLVGCGLAEL